MLLTNKRYTKHIEQNFHSVAGVMPQGRDFGLLGGSKTLARGFAMAPHRLCILVYCLLLLQFFVRVGFVM